MERKKHVDDHFRGNLYFSGEFITFCVKVIIFWEHKDNTLDDDGAADVWIEVKLLKVMLTLVLYMGVTGLVCSHFLMLGKAPTVATRADIAGHPVKSLSSIRAFGWLGRGTFKLTNW